MRGNMKKNGFGKGFWAGIITGLPIAAIAILILLARNNVQLDQLFSKNGMISAQAEQKITEIQAVIHKYYLEEVDSQTMEDAVSSGLMAGLGDPYAAYYNKEEYEDLVEKNNGNYCGIGAYVSQNVTTGAITIIQPMEDSPAEKAGLKAGDIVYAVDGQEVAGEDLSSVVAKMKGEKGTEVELQIVREGESDFLAFTLTREEIETKTVNFQMLQGKVGYIAVSAFEEVTEKQFDQALEELEQQGQKKLIIDLRNNGGGLLQTAVDMLDRMLPKGKVVYTRDKYGQGEEYYSDDKESFDKPVVILVNENTASASEVFAGAMQDYGRGTLLGVNTFGKGIVQSVITLSDGTAVKLTTSKYYTPNGRNIHGSGLKPDVNEPLNNITTKLGKNGPEVDNQIKAALDYLQQ